MKRLMVVLCAFVGAYILSFFVLPTTPILGVLSLFIQKIGIDYKLVFATVIAITAMGLGD